MKFYLKRFSDGVQCVPVGIKVENYPGFEIVDEIPKDVLDQFVAQELSDKQKTADAKNTITADAIRDLQARVAVLESKLEEAKI